MSNGLQMEPKCDRAPRCYPSFIREFVDGEPVPMPKGEKWWDTIKRITVPGQVAQIDKEMYWHFLEILPPRFQLGEFFAFAEGLAPFLLFWRDGDGYFCKQLTWNQSKKFCRLANLPEECWAL